MALAESLRWIADLLSDLYCVIASLGMLAAYYSRHAAKVKADPSYSIHYVNSVARRAWVEHVMSSAGMEIMAVQTLRNFIMNGILMVSTTCLLIVGTLTLSGQAETIAHSWNDIAIGGQNDGSMWIIKIQCMLAVLLIAFFCYCLSIRLANQVVFMINVPTHEARHQLVLSPEAVADRLNRAGQFVAIGTRS